MRRILLPSLVAALVLVLVAVVLGLLIRGDGDEEDGLSEREQTYVGDVCQALGSFAQSAQPAVAQLTNPSSLTAIEQGLDRLQQALQQLSATLEEMEPPEAARTQHRQILRALSRSSTSFEDVTEALAEGETGQIEEITTSAEELEVAFGGIEDFPPEFVEAFRQHPTCRQAETFFGGEEVDRFAPARAAEANASPDLPGEWVNLPAIYGGAYGSEFPNTNAHVRDQVDYENDQGLPPAGGPHWGSAACPDDPDTSPLFCGPAPWGIYRQPWPAESLVHNLEHSGVVIWYNTTDPSIIAELEDFAEDNANRLLVLTPHPELEPETIAITAWSRRDKFPVSELDRGRLQRFLDAHECRFDPEGLC